MAFNYSMCTAIHQYGLETAQELMVTIRDLRRIVKIGTEWATALFPNEAHGLHLMYNTLDRDLLQLFTCTCIVLAS